jgi:hypothetical protein
MMSSIQSMPVELAKAMINRSAIGARIKKNIATKQPRRGPVKIPIMFRIGAIGKKKKYDTSVTTAKPADGSGGGGGAAGGGGGCGGGGAYCGTGTGIYCTCGGGAGGGGGAAGAGISPELTGG